MMVCGMKSNRSDKITKQLIARRNEMGISCADLAQRSRLGHRTVQRIFSGEDANPRLATVLALAEAMGVDLQVAISPVNAIRQRQASRKAEKLVSLVQGTSALEAQGLSAKEVRRLQVRTARELLRGPKHRLWAE